MVFLLLQVTPDMSYIGILVKLLSKLRRFMEFVSDFTPCIHDILSILMVMILCVDAQG